MNNSDKNWPSMWLGKVSNHFATTLQLCEIPQIHIRHVENHVEIFPVASNGGNVRR